MRLRGACLVAALFLSGRSLAAGTQPYGCWAIRDTVERLACFDLALGPPALGPSTDGATAGQDRPTTSEAVRPVPQPGTVTRD